MAKASKCPICRKAEPQPAFDPFCSKRCADVDLSRWLGGGYAIPVEEDNDEDGEQPGGVSRDAEGDTTRH